MTNTLEFISAEDNGYKVFLTAVRKFNIYTKDNKLYVSISLWEARM